ncbi:hypothetical protein Tco_1306343, partial [Tanacetum coccineum]
MLSWSLSLPRHWPTHRSIPRFPRRIKFFSWRRIKIFFEGELSSSLGGELRFSLKANYSLYWRRIKVFFEGELVSFEGELRFYFEGELSSSLGGELRVAKDLWERVQLLMQGTSLTKQERECKLYDAFDKFAHIKGESLHQYYLRFTQLINDINIYKMKLEQFQVNTKFLNSLPPEWGNFVNDVKLLRYFHTTNFDQLHAYLEQHELYTNEVRIMRECNQDPLALVANHQMTPSHFNTYQSSYNNPQFQQQFSPSQSPQYGSIHPTQHYSTTYPSTPRAITNTSIPHPNAYSSTVHQDACPQPQSITKIEYTISIVNQQTHLAKFPQIDSGLVVPAFKQGDDPID